MPPGIAFKGAGAEVRVSSSSSVGRVHGGDQTMFPERGSRGGSESIKIKRLQQQQSFPGRQMTVSLNFDDLSAPMPPQDVESVEAGTASAQSAFNGGVPRRSSGAQPQQAWHSSAEAGDPWASRVAPPTRRAAAATELTNAVQTPAPQPEPEVMPWAVQRTKITSSPAKHSVQIRIPDDRTAYDDPASDEHAFAGRRGADGGVPRSKLAMAEVRQRRLQQKQKMLAEQGKQSKLRELEEGIRSRRAAAAAAAAAAATGDEEIRSEAATTATSASGEASRRPTPRSPARSKRRGQPKLSPARASANQKAAAKRLSQPAPKPPAVDVVDPTNTSPQDHSNSQESAPRPKTASSARGSKSTVDWDSLLVLQSGVETLDSIEASSSKSKSNSKSKTKGKGKLKGRNGTRSKQIESSTAVRSAEATRAAKARDVRRHSMDPAATNGGKWRVDKVSVTTEGAVGQLKNTWQQLQNEPGGKRSMLGGASTVQSFGSRLGKPRRVMTPSRTAASATSHNDRSAESLRSVSATQKRKRRKSGAAASAAQKNDSRNSLDSLLTDETPGSHSSSPLIHQQARNATPSPLNLGRTEQANENESMLQEMKALLADLIQQEEIRAEEESQLLELRKAAAHGRADAELKRVLADGPSGSENQDAHTMITVKLADELAEIGKSTAYHRVESVRQKLNLQRWAERVVKLCDEADALRRGIGDAAAHETTVRELMETMQLGNDQRVATMDELRARFEGELQQQKQEQEDALHTTVQHKHHHQPSSRIVEETRQPGSPARLSGVAAGDGESTAVGVEDTEETDDGDGVGDEESAEDSVMEDVKALAVFLGIDPSSEPHLLWIARQCLDAQLPPAWSEYFEEASGNAYYYNELTKITTWDHPLDSHFKALVQEERLAHVARKVLSTANYSTGAGGTDGRSPDGRTRGDQAVVQSNEAVDGHNSQGDIHETAIGQNDPSCKPAPPKARIVQSTNGKPLDLSDLIVSASTTPAKDSPDRTKQRTMMSPKSLAMQIITLSSDSDTDGEQHMRPTDASMVGKLIPASTSAAVASSPGSGYSDQSTLDVDALERSLLEHHRSTSPSPHQGQQIHGQQKPEEFQNDEIMSDISAHSETSEDEDGLSPHELPPILPKLDDDLDTSLSQTELDVIVQQLHHIEDEEDDAMCEQDRDAKAMAALRSIATRTVVAPPVASPGPSYVEPVLSPSRRTQPLSKEASQSGLSALRKMVKEALACTDLKMVELMIQEVMTRGQQLQDEQQRALQPDVEKLIAAAHRMGRITTKVDSDSGDDQYADDDFEDEDDMDAQAANATTVDPPTVAQKSPSSPATPTIDPVQTSSPTKKELMAGIGEADNAFAYANAIQNELAEGLAIKIHELSDDAALSSRTQHGKTIDSDDYASYRNDFAQDIAQSVSDSGVWSDELSLAGPVESSDQNITGYIRSLFEFARRQLGNPDPEVSPRMRKTLESEIALSFVLEKTHEPNHQLFVALERERERVSAEEGATAVVTEAQQIYNMALFDVCAEVVAAELASASAMQRKRQRWFGTGQEQDPANAMASFCLTQEMLTQRVLANTKWQLRTEDVQPPGFRSSAGGSSPQVLGAGVHDGPRHLGHRHQRCVVDSIVHEQFVAESRWWFDRAEEEEELQHYLADHILDMLVRETVGVLDAVQKKHTRQVAVARETGCPG